MTNRNITVIGHDNRTAIVHSMLIRDGFEVAKITQKEQLLHADLSDIIIFPIPYKDAAGKIKGTEVHLSDISSKLTNTSFVILGRADNAFTDLAARIGFKYIDINEDRRFKILNAVPTAEAAIAIAMERTDYTLFGSNAMVCGYGCIAKCLVKLLKAFGCNVTVAARKQADLYDAEYVGCNTVSIDNIANVITEQDIIFNTCPAPVLNADSLSKAKQKCIIIDLASRPGGCDFEFAKQAGIDAKLYLSLPDVYAPQTSGENMYKIILSIINELQ